MISRLDLTSRSWRRTNILSVAQVVLVIVVCVGMGLIGHVQCANYTVGAGYVEPGAGTTWTNTVSGLLKPTILQESYRQWASSVNVTVGDTLTFEYRLGAHSVFLVSTETAFLNCDFTGAVQVPDGVPTTYTVKSTDSVLYFVCNIPGHCLQGGQKVKVIPVGAKTISPPGTPTSNTPQQYSTLSARTTAMLLFVSIFILHSCTQIL